MKHAQRQRAPDSVNPIVDRGQWDEHWFEAQAAHRLNASSAPAPFFDLGVVRYIVDAVHPAMLFLRSLDHLCIVLDADACYDA